MSVSLDSRWCVRKPEHHKLGCTTEPVHIMLGLCRGEALGALLVTHFGFALVTECLFNSFSRDASCPLLGLPQKGHVVGLEHTQGVSRAP